MRWQDSGFNTEDCSWTGIQLRNLKPDKIVPSVGIWPKNSFWTLIHKKIWKVHTDWLWTGFSPPCLPGCHDTFSWMLVSQHPRQVFSAALSRTSSRIANSSNSRRGSGFGHHESSTVECFLTASASGWAPDFILGTKWTTGLKCSTIRCLPVCKGL